MRTTCLMSCLMLLLSATLPAAERFEAEHAQFSNGSLKSDPNDLVDAKQQSSAGQFVRASDNFTITWTITNHPGGWVDLGFANKIKQQDNNGSGETRLINVYVNDNKVGVLEMSSVFWREKWLRANLLAGNNEIELRNAGTSEGTSEIDVDYLAVGITDTAPTGAEYYNISDYGAIGDGDTLNTSAIQEAIDDAAAAADGGIVYIPSGIFVSGTLELKSNVTLHLHKRATLFGVGVVNNTNYPKMDPESGSPTNYKSFLTDPDEYPQRVFIYAKRADNVGITGGGTIDGNGHDSDLFLTGSQGDRKSCVNGIRFIECSNVRMHGDSISDKLFVTNTGHWAVQPMNCDGVHMRYVRIEEYGGVTPDGLPISDCRNVLIEDCFVASDDDALGLKCGSPFITVENIIVKRSTFQSANTGFKCGSPQSWGEFNNVQFIGCDFEKLPDYLNERSSTEHHGFFIGTINSHDENINNNSGVFRNVLIEDCIVRDTRMPFAMYSGNSRSGQWGQWYTGEGLGPEDAFGLVEDVTIRNVSYTDPSNYGVLIEGRDGFPIRNLTLENLYFPNTGGRNKSSHTAIPDEKTGEYPNMSKPYGRMPAYGFFIRHVENLETHNVWVWTESTDIRDAVVEVNTVNVNTSGILAGTKPDNYLPAVSFDNIQDGTVLDGGLVTIQAHARDHDGHLTKVELFLNGTLLGELSTDASTNHQLWSIDVEITASGTLEVVATDSDGETASVTVSVTINNGGSDNQPPLLNFVSPNDGDAFSTGETIAVQIDAQDSDGIAQVALTSNGRQIAIELSHPYGFSLVESEPGTYTLIATATDTLGATSSAMIDITVVEPPSNAAPTVNFLQPMDGDTLTVPADLDVVVDAFDSDGSINRIELTNNGAPAGTEREAPYTWALFGLTAGRYTLEATAYDNEGAQTTVAIAVNITSEDPERVVTLVLTRDGSPIASQAIDVTNGPTGSLITTNDNGVAIAYNLSTLTNTLFDFLTNGGG